MFLLISFIETGMQSSHFYQVISRFLFAAGFLLITAFLCITLLLVTWAAAIPDWWTSWLPLFGQKHTSGKVKFAYLWERPRSFGQLLQFSGRFFPLSARLAFLLRVWAWAHWRNFGIYNISGRSSYSSTMFVLLGYGIPSSEHLSCWLWNCWGLWSPQLWELFVGACMG